MDSLSAAKAIKGPIATLGAKFMTEPATFARGSELGFKPGFEFYVAGRFGPLGTVPGDVVAASAVFMNPAQLKELWATVLSTTTPKRAAALYNKICQEHGRANLTAGKRTKRFAELAGTVVDSANIANAPIVGAWRSLPRSRNAASAAGQMLHIMRELRMARHGVAIQAEGLSPLEAILAGPGGAGNAKMFGWPEPYPDVEAVRERRAAAEEVTNRLCAADLEVLSASERAELVKLVTGFVK